MARCQDGPPDPSAPLGYIHRPVRGVREPPVSHNSRVSATKIKEDNALGEAKTGHEGEVAHKAQYCRHDHGPDPFICWRLLHQKTYEYDMLFFGVAGSNNDINVILRSPLLNDLKLEKAPEIPFVANDVTYPWGYYLYYGIYPEWVPYVKLVTNLADDNHKRLRYKAMEEGQ
nr:protein ALP1-like isoform X1 [Tanacetum cinerariifolium]